jgi:hypothetical protein
VVCPTCRVKSIFWLAVTCRVTGSTTAVLNPASDADSLYEPGMRLVAL